MRLKPLIPVRSGEWGLLVGLVTALMLHEVVVEISDVVATAGFVSRVGTTDLVWMWMVDMAVALGAASLYSAVVDRTRRRPLIQALLAGLAVIYLALDLLQRFAAPAWLTYTGLYLLTDQQGVVFPLAFWALVSDQYSVADGRRLFPLIASGKALGSIIGNGVAAEAGRFFDTGTSETTPLLLLNVALLVVTFILLTALSKGFKGAERRAEQPRQPWRETLKAGVGFFTQVPLFRYMAVTAFACSAGLTLVEFHFLSAVDLALAHYAGRLETFLGLYKIGLTVALLLVQWLITGPVSRKVGIQNSFTALPAAVLTAAAGALAVPGAIGAAGGRFLARLVQGGWDEPARRSLQSLIPDERRGSVSAFMDSYFFAFATTAGCLVLLGLELFGGRAWLVGRTSSVIYLSCAAAAGAVALWSGWRMRQVYETSLFNWRLNRSKRKSVLDNIEF